MELLTQAGGISPSHHEAFQTTYNFQTQRLGSHNWTQTLSVFPKESK